MRSRHENIVILIVVVRTQTVPYIQRAACLTRIYGPPLLFCFVQRQRLAGTCHLFLLHAFPRAFRFFVCFLFLDKIKHLFAHTAIYARILCFLRLSKLRTYTTSFEIFRAFFSSACCSRILNRTHGTDRNLRYYISLFLLLWGTILNRTYGTHKNPYIYIAGFTHNISVLFTMVPRNNN